MTKKAISFIINPISGTHKKDSWPEIIYQIIDTSRFDIRIFFSEREGHAFELACQQVEKGVPYIVAVGGDGTVNEVAKSLRDSSAALGIVPCGSGNGLARHLQIPLKLTEALELINNASVVRIDYGMVNELPFFCTFGTGFDARISHVFAKSEKRGFWTYLRHIIKEFFSYRAAKYKLKVDGNKLKTKAIVLTIANSSQYGNNGYISPHADITDGKLDVCIVRPVSRLRAGFLALRLLRKNIDKSSYYHTIRGKKITIRRKHKGEVHLDGNPYMLGKKMNVKIVPKGLKVLVNMDFIH